jgi:phage terminase small subunit
MTPKQERFVQEYLIDLNATQAAIRAGYSAKTADVQGPRLLGDVGVAAKIAEAQKETAIVSGITRERVLRETEILAHSCVDHYMVDDLGNLVLAPGAPADAMRAVSSVKYRTTTTGTGENARTERTCEFKLWDKPGMVKMAGRHVDVHGFWDKAQEETGTHRTLIQIMNVLGTLPVDTLKSLQAAMKALPETVDAEVVKP